MDEIPIFKSKIFFFNIDESINAESNDIGYCLGTKSHIGILSNGDVVPCCLDSDGLMKFGNIFDSNLDEIINSKLFKEINNGFKNNKVVSSICQHCFYRKRFDK